MINPFKVQTPREAKLNKVTPIEVRLKMCPVCKAYAVHPSMGHCMKCNEPNSDKHSG
jgi:hypothetical protein